MEQRLIDANALKKDLVTAPNGDMWVYREDIDNAPTVEAISKADYENRLKADMVAMFTELKTEIDKQCKIPNNNASAYDWNNGVYSCYKVVQQKIDKLKEVEE